MILFVFEGSNREPTLFKTLEYLYFSQNKEIRICSYNNNIYNLYKQMTGSDFPQDIITILKGKLETDKDNPLKKIRRRSDFSEVYLFFDYDCHNNQDTNLSNQQIREMLNFFDDESSDFGKLFINYPMVESIHYSRTALPDNDFYLYTTPISLGKGFKKKVNDESYYKNLDFISFRMNKRSLSIKIPDDINKIERVRKNWEYLQEMNVKKANYICNGNVSLPEKEDEINQKNIFSNQLIKYVEPNKEIAILNSFPLFIYEYKGKISNNSEVSKC